MLLFALAACQGTSNARPAPLPGPRLGHRVEIVTDGLLACGGFGNTDVGDDRGARATWWLADGTSSWRRCADMPRPRAFFGSASHGGAVYAIGDGVDRFDIGAGTWQPTIAGGVLPTSHFGVASGGGRVWVLGGYPVEHSACFEVDLERGRAERREPPPGFTPGDHFHFLAWLRGELHVMGGLDVATFQPRREHWVRRSGVWVALQQPPAGLWAKFAGSAVVGDRLHLFGDFGHHVFDAANGQWRTAAPLPFPVVMPAVVARGGSIWIVGGERLDNTPIGIVEYEIAADRWIVRAGVQAPGP
jgi:hypothetical protein